jgi:alanine-glyoxylate transaminase/serine-glyoxylate transaminase/serine-pyruvate transaminase
MVPPGLALLFIRDTVWPLHAVAGLKSPYWNWEPRAKPTFYAARFCGTAPTHHLYGLREAIDMLQEEGMENVWERHRVQASAVWAAVEAWGTAGALELNVPLVSDRSLAVTCINTMPGLAPRLRQWCEQNAGLTLGIGLNNQPTGEPRENVFRIGHMGHLNPHSLLGTLACIEAALKALGVTVSDSGVDAAVSVIADATTERCSALGPGEAIPV